MRSFMTAVSPYLAKGAPAKYIREMADLFDKRSEWFKKFFNEAKSYQDYLATGTAQQVEKWRAFEGKIALTTSQEKILSGFTREMNILVLSGIWCGDCARQCPMLALIASRAKAINLRFIDNQAHPELRDEMRICGGTRVPVALILSEDFFEVSRFGDRHLSVYRRKAVNELGPACDSGLAPPSGEELSTETNEWVEFIERAQLMLRLSPFLRARHGD